MNEFPVDVHTIDPKVTLLFSPPKGGGSSAMIEQIRNHRLSGDKGTVLLITDMTAEEAYRRLVEGQPWLEEFECGSSPLTDEQLKPMFVRLPVLGVKHAEGYIDDWKDPPSFIGFDPVRCNSMRHGLYKIRRDLWDLSIATGAKVVAVVRTL